MSDHTNADAVQEKPATQKVDIYVLPSAHSDARLTFISRLVSKCHQQALKTLIVTDNVSWLNDINQSLWQKPVASFIAHERFDDSTQPPLPNVLLATPDVLPQLTAMGFAVDVCIDELSEMMNMTFPRVLIVADQDEERLRLGRTKYQHYQQNGVTPTLHQLGKTS